MLSSSDSVSLFQIAGTNVFVMGFVPLLASAWALLYNITEKSAEVSDGEMLAIGIMALAICLIGLLVWVFLVWRLEIENFVQTRYKSSQFSSDLLFHLASAALLPVLVFLTQSKAQDESSRLLVILSMSAALTYIQFSDGGSTQTKFAAIATALFAAFKLAQGGELIFKMFSLMVALNLLLLGSVAASLKRLDFTYIAVAVIGGPLAYAIFLARQLPLVDILVEKPEILTQALTLSFLITMMALSFSFLTNNAPASVLLPSISIVVVYALGGSYTMSFIALFALCAVGDGFFIQFRTPSRSASILPLIGIAISVLLCILISMSAVPVAEEQKANLVEEELDSAFSKISSLQTGLHDLAMRMTRQETSNSRKDQIELRKQLESVSLEVSQLSVKLDGALRRLALGDSPLINFDSSQYVTESAGTTLEEREEKNDAVDLSIITIIQDDFYSAAGFDLFAKMLEAYLVVQPKFVEVIVVDASQSFDSKAFRLIPSVSVKQVITTHITGDLINLESVLVNAAIRSCASNRVLVTSSQVAFSKSLLEKALSVSIEGDVFYRIPHMQYQLVPKFEEYDQYMRELADKKVVVTVGKAKKTNPPIEWLAKTAAENKLASDMAHDFVMASADSWRSVQGLDILLPSSFAALSQIVCTFDQAGFEQVILPEPSVHRYSNNYQEESVCTNDSSGNLDAVDLSVVLITYPIA